MTTLATTKLEGASYGPHNESKPGHLVILLHGYGADGNDLIGLAPVLGPLMPDVVFYAPNAPYPCEGNPFGYQWFPVSRLDPALALAGVRSAAPLVDAFLDEKMAEHGLKSRPPILLAHGDSDEMLPHVLTERAAEALRQNGVPVVVHIAEGVGHGINETALSHAARFLLEAFKLPLPK